MTTGGLTPVVILRELLVKKRTMMGRSTPAKPENALVRYFRDTRAEISKVTWPTREEGIRLTWVVTVVTLISAIVLFGIDAMFSFIVALLIRVI
jgi:preprotein translocase subunit SecE